MAIAHLPCLPKKRLASETLSLSQSMQLRLFQAECVAIGLLNMQAIPPHLGEIYLSWYYHEQNYHLDEYFLELLSYLCS